jgi:hypothetical protein
MPFEALAYGIALQFDNVPPERAPLVFPFGTEEQQNRHAEHSSRFPPIVSVSGD